MSGIQFFRTIVLATATLGLAGPALADGEALGNGDIEVLATQGRTGTDGKRKDAGAPELTRKSAPPARGDGARLDRKAPTTADAESVNQDFWIYDANTAIAGDLDGDGFYTRLELDLDADTVYESAWVYAVLYLSLEGGAWTEYGETAVFDIYGASGGDVYFFDVDLVSGFPTGYYDVLIELYDDYDGRLVATLGPADSADLFDLPLESETLDEPFEPVVIITDEGGGGSAGLGLVTLLSLALWRRRQRLDVTDELSVVAR